MGTSCDARGGPLPTAAQLAAWFPDPFNADTWNFAAISPLVRTYTIGIGDFPTCRSAEVRRVGAGRLENLRSADPESRCAMGHRLNAFANDVEVGPPGSAVPQAGLPKTSTTSSRGSASPIS